MRNYHDTDLPAIYNGSISVIVTYLGSGLNIFVESNPGDFSESELCKAVARKDKKLPVARLLGYFKITDGENNPITDFPDGLQIKISYSPLAWKLANNGNPRVGHLSRNNNQWAEEWEEFRDREKDVIVECTSPPDDDSYGYVTITVTSLPDPLIGDC